MVRFKNRYLLVELLWREARVDTSLTEAGILQAIRESLSTNFGDVGAGSALASLQVKYLNPYTSLCVLRCSTDELRQVWASLTLITTIGTRKTILRLRHLGGTLKTCQEAAISLDQKILDSAQLTKAQLQDAARRSEVLKTLEL